MILIKPSFLFHLEMTVFSSRYISELSDSKKGKRTPVTNIMDRECVRMEHLTYKEEKNVRNHWIYF
ncbi:hypothetical protein ATG71_3127 [Bacillus sp. es.034]|jgi:hypothetical protein|nr:hypothetical protein ATG71_3127 [Bacillus sp. es.034]